jgi:glycosyltransferase involved in cell wall biosynthesis
MNRTMAPLYEDRCCAGSTSINCRRSGDKLKSHLVIIPAFNEEEHIGGVLDEVIKMLPGMDVLVVNDGSADNTSTIAKDKGVVVLDLPFNIGYGGAVQTGFRFAVENAYDFVIIMDGDGQHDPRYAKNLIDTIDSEKADVVIGSRFLEGTYKMGPARRAGAWLFSRIASVYTGTKFTDPTSGFQILNRNVFSYLAGNNNYPLDYPDVNIIMALHKMKFKVVEAPVKMRQKEGGSSMHSGLKPILYVIRMFLAVIMVLMRKED